MLLLAILLGAGVLLALIGTVGLAGLQDWGMILFVPIIAGVTAGFLGGLGIAVMVLAEALSGAEVRAGYNAADFWSAALLLGYAAAVPLTLLGLRSQRRNPN